MLDNATLVRGVTSIALPPDLRWTDEFAWSPVGQVSTVTLTGALIVEEAAQQAGRPITLSSVVNGSQYTAVVDRSTVEALQALAAIPGALMVLTLADERVFNVRWRHEGGPPMTAEPWRHVVPATASDLHTIPLKFMQT